MLADSLFASESHADGAVLVRKRRFAMKNDLAFCSIRDPYNVIRCGGVWKGMVSMESVTDAGVRTGMPTEQQ